MRWSRSRVGPQRCCVCALDNVAAESGRRSPWGSLAGALHSLHMRQGHSVAGMWPLCVAGLKNRCNDHSVLRRSPVGHQGRPGESGSSGPGLDRRADGLRGGRWPRCEHLVRQRCCPRLRSAGRLDCRCRPGWMVGPGLHQLGPLVPLPAQERQQHHGAEDEDKDQFRREAAHAMALASPSGRWPCRRRCWRSPRAWLCLPACSSCGSSP
jgi:hypothetical protein